MTERNNTKKKYTIIDHVGSIADETMLSAAYAKAYALNPKGQECFSLKKFCHMMPNDYEQPKALWQKKLEVRYWKHPSNLIFICSDLNWKALATLETWDVDPENIKIILVQEDIEVLTMRDVKPEWYAQKEATDSIYRRCANIWGQALGWEFSAPLYRDKGSEINVMQYKRNDRNILIENGNGDHITKTSHTPEAYMRSKMVASEEECQEFFRYYKYLKTNNILEEFLESDWEICPECGRPIRLSQEECTYCTFRPNRQTVELSRYWEDSNADEDWD
jgi:hypothetical protein